jgi:glucose/mannose-6-phosphate isomerase
VTIDLDDIRAIKAKDSAGALTETDRYADQFREGQALVEDFNGEIPDRPERILILGTGGGSAASANLLRAAVVHRCLAPIELNQGYEIPAHVGPDTFVIAVSHSGTTEEILSAYGQALARGCPSVVLTSGGQLREMAESRGAPVLKVPGGKMPRIVLGYLIVPLLVLLARMALIESDATEFEDLIEVLGSGRSRFGVEVPLEHNPAKQLALFLEGHTPVVYGLDPLTSAAADRWKRQFGENSKVMAFANSYPATHHDEAVGWDQEREILQRFSFVILSDERANDRLLRRVAASREVLSQRSARVQVLQSSGSATLGRLFSLVHLGDYVSLYLALRRAIDPTPVAVIDQFKSALAKV